MKKITFLFLFALIGSASLYAGDINTTCPTISFIVKIVSNVSCYGDSNGMAVIMAGNGTAPYVFSWSNGSTSDTAKNLTVGVYTLNVTDSNGCPGSTTVIITQPSPLKLKASSVDVSCNGACNGSASVIIGGGSTPYTFLWNNGQTSGSISNLCPGTYSFMVMDANKCIADTNGILVNGPTALRDSITGIKNVTCNGGNDGSAVSSMAGGTVPYTYSWNTVPVQTSAVASGLTAGTYSVINTDANGCVVMSTVTITQAAVVVPTATITPTVICIGNAANLATAATGGTPPYNFSWSPSNCTGTLCTIGPNITTTYTITVTDSNGCVGAPITSVLQVSPLPNAAFTASSVCMGTPTVFTNTSTGATSFNWDPGDGTSGSTATDPTHTYWASGTFNAQLIATSANGCSDTITLPVTVNPNPVVAFSSNSVCLGNSTQFTDMSTIAPPSTINSWSWKFGDSANGTASVTNPAYTYAMAGSYNVTLTLTSNNGCMGSVTDTVNVIPNPQAAFTYSGACIGSGNTFAFTDESSGAVTQWTWYFGDATSSSLQNPVHTYPGAGTYTITEAVQSACGADTIHKTIQIGPAGGFDLTGSLQICVDTPSVSTASIQACIFNNNCLVVKGTMKLLLDTAFHITNTVSDSVAHVSGDTLIWNYINLSDTGMIHCVSLTGNISSVPAGDSIFASLFITPVVGDSNPSNNSFTYWIKPSLNNCVGLPFDPNSKSVMPEGDISATQQLTYTVHFQNTGTAKAKNVVVIDTLSPYVDPTTLRVTSSSSQVVTTIASGHIVKFTFNNINLPDSTVSKTSSIGIIEYTIYPMSTDVGGDVIKNGAGIYFDANPVVKTNTTVSTIATKAVSVENISAPSFNIKCFPNPFTSATSVVFNTDGKHYLEVDDITGRVVESIECTGKQYELSGNNLAKGVYFIKAYNGDKSSVAVTKVVLQ